MSSEKPRLLAGPASRYSLPSTTFVGMLCRTAFARTCTRAFAPRWIRTCKRFAQAKPDPGIGAVRGHEATSVRAFSSRSITSISVRMAAAAPGAGLVTRAWTLGCSLNGEAMKCETWTADPETATRMQIAGAQTTTTRWGSHSSTWRALLALPIGAVPLPIAAAAAMLPRRKRPRPHHHRRHRLRHPLSQRRERVPREHRRRRTEPVMILTRLTLTRAREAQRRGKTAPLGRPWLHHHHPPSLGRTTGIAVAGSQMRCCSRAR